MKKKINLYLDEKVIVEAKDIGINLSKLCENAIIDAINRLQGLSTLSSGAGSSLARSDKGTRTTVRGNPDPGQSVRDWSLGRASNLK